MTVNQSGRILHVRTDKDTNFTGTLAQNVGLQETLTPGTNGYPTALKANMRAILRSMVILSKENLAWEVWLFGSSTFASTDADTEYFLGRWTFVAGDGIRATVGVTTDTYYHYYIDGLQISMRNKPLDVTGNIYMRLVNRSAAGKSAGAAGEIVIDLGVEPTQGY
jgi:hypothetical protein